MADNQQIKTTLTTSKLERFNIGFEYDKTLHQVKRDVYIRTI
jgi:hypothetical protein